MNENTKEDFLSIYKDSIKREGADKLLDWLNKTDFFFAPASGKYHSCFEGGLCFHSLNVYKRLLTNVKNELRAELSHNADQINRLKDIMLKNEVITFEDI